MPLAVSLLGNHYAADTPWF